MHWPRPLAALAAAVAAAALSARSLPAQRSRRCRIPASTGIAAREKETALRSLREAGVAVVEDPTEASYLLRVTIGVPQGMKACGQLRNAKFALRREGRTVLGLASKGWTGACEPHVFETLSRELALALGDEDGQQSQTKGSAP